MEKGKSFMPIYFWVGVGVVCLIMAFLAAGKDQEPDAMQKLADTVKSQTESITSIQKLNNEFNNRLYNFEKNLMTQDQVKTIIADQLSTFVDAKTGHDIKHIKAEVEALKSQQHVLEKKLIAKERQLNIKFLNDVPSLSPKPEAKGKGKEALLKKSGVSQ